MKIKSLKGLLFLWGLFTASVVFGQTVTGTVTGDNLPLPGVNIVIEGTQKGTVTDFDGLYSLDGVEEGDVLVFSSIGFTTKNITYIGNPVINVNLEEDIKSLDEVVVVGYTKTTRDKLTIAVSTVDAEELSEVPAATINDALEGRSSGVRVASNGSPGENKPVIIRGLSTFGDATPLYVVDGVFVDNISQISPEAIAKVDILKDAAATAVYGSRGSNGVIIVTTKKGKAGKPKFGFSTYAGVQFLNRNLLPDLVSGPDLAKIFTEEDIRISTFNDNGSVITVGRDNVPSTQNNTPDRLLDPNFVPSNTNATDALFREAEIKNYNLDFSGGSDNATFSVNASHFDQEGIAKQTRFRRYSLNINSDFKVLDKFRVGQSFNIGYSRSNLPITFRGQALQNWAVRFPNFLPLVNQDGLFVNADRNLDGITNDTFNPLLPLATQFNEQTQFNTYGNLYAEIDVFSGLTFRNSIAFNIFNQEVDERIDSFSASDENPILVGEGFFEEKQITFTRRSSLLTTLTSQLNYNKTFGNHNLSANAIFERTDNKQRFFTIQNTSALPNGFTEFNQNGISLADSNTLPDVLTSYVGLLGYSYANKYFFNGSIRRDASSKFAEPVGIFRSISGAWNVSREAFFDPISGIVSNFKIRAGFGETGNNRIPPFQDQVNLVSVVAPRIGGVEQTGFSLRGQVQSGLTWETSIKENYGVELGFLGDKITFTGEYYNNRSENLIAVSTLAPSSGDSVIGNVGSSRANGFEFSLGYNDNVGDFKWSFWGQVTTANTEITEIDSASGAEEILGQELSVREGISTEAGVSRIRIGEPVWGIYGDRTDGLYRSLDEIIDSETSNAFYVLKTDDLNSANVNGLTRTFDANGNAVFTDASGGEVDRADVAINPERGTALGDIRFTENDVLIGDPNPDFTYSFNLKASYKNLDFSALFTGVQGVDVINALNILPNTFVGVSTANSSILDRYTAVNTDSNFPRYSATDPNRNVRISDRFIEDGSYLRLRSVILGYSLKQDFLSGILNGTLDKLRFYVQGQNLFTITNYSGLDPEIRPSFSISENGVFNNTIAGLGVDRGTAPAPVSVIFGVQIGF